MVKKDWKTTLHLLHGQPTEVEYSSSLSLPQPFCSRIVFLCFHLFLVSVLFTGPSLIVVNFYRKVFTPSMSKCTVLRKNGLSKRDYDAHLEAYLTISMLHPPLAQKIDISNSGAVIQYVERLHTSCSFRVTSVSTHKMVY